MQKHEKHAVAPAHVPAGKLLECLRRGRGALE